MQDIIIIGGGISGLYCGLNINKNKNVILFEKNNYLGGRIYTDNFTINSNEYNFEAGAGRIHSKHMIIQKLIAKMGLKDKLIKIGGSIVFKPSKKYSLKNTFKNQNGFSYVNHLIKLSKSENKDYLKSISFKEYADKHLSDDEVKFMLDSCGYYGDLLFNAYDAIKSFEKEITTDSEYYIMKGGFSQLINKMVSHIKKKHSIYTNKNCIDIFYNDNVFTLNINNTKISCKKLILAIPKPNLLNFKILKPYFPLLKSIECIPLLRLYSIYKKDDIWFKNVSKTTTNNHLKYIIPINKETGAIMTSYTDYTNTNYWKNIMNNNNNLNNEIKKNIENVFNIKTKNPILNKKYYWDCGVALWKKNNDSNKIIKTINNIHKHNIPIFIVGENYSLYQGWMEGALHSAQNCLDNI